MKLENKQKTKYEERNPISNILSPKFFFVLFMAFMTVGSALGQSTAPLCEPCITVDPIEQGVPDELSGVYRSWKNITEHQFIEEKSTFTK